MKTRSSRSGADDMMTTTRGASSASASASRTSAHHSQPTSTDSADSIKSKSGKGKSAADDKSDMVLKRKKAEKVPASVVTIRSKNLKLKRPFSQIDEGVNSENVGIGTVDRGKAKDQPNSYSCASRKSRRVDWSSSGNTKMEEVGTALDIESKENVTVAEASKPRTRGIHVAKTKAEKNNSKPQTVEPIQSNCDMKCEVKKETDFDPDEGETEESFDYIRMREANMKANEEFFASLGMDEAKKQLQESAPSVKKYNPSQKGLRVKKEPEVLVRRQSLRIRRVDPKGTPLPEPEPTVESVAEVRLPDGPIDMKDCILSQAETQSEDDYIASFTTLIRNQTSVKKTVVPDSLTNLLSEVSINENRVAKVVPGRVFSVTWHPSSTCLMTAAGDKYGNLGLWNVEKDQENVLAFKPHTKPVSHLYFPEGQHKLFSCSYDATLRCGDFEKGVFDEIFSVPEEEDDLLRNFEFFDDDKTMLVSHFRGFVSVVDTRTPGSSAEQVYNVSRKSLRTVSVHPVNRHHFITAGVEAKINLWDLRNINAKTPKPLQTLTHHTKAISSAYFSPDGGKILSCSSDDTIVVCSVDGGMQLSPFKTIRHNNWTGRWLTNFRPTWHPFVKDVFVTGSMRRPREIEVYAANGTLIKSLHDENYLGSVCSLNEFHPRVECAVVGANSSGRLHVFM